MIEENRPSRDADDLQCPGCGQPIARDARCANCNPAIENSSGIKASDLTPVSGGWTDVTPLGRALPKPLHELTADEDRDVTDWARVAAMPEFKAMVRAKVRFVVPVTILFIVYYFALLILVGYAPGLMDRKIFGFVNLAYLFALSQFFMAWLIAALYVRVAGRYDAMSEKIIARLDEKQGEQ